MKKSLTILILGFFAGVTMVSAQAATTLKITNPVINQTLIQGEQIITTWVGADAGVSNYAVYLSGGSLTLGNDRFLGIAYASQGNFVWSVPADLAGSGYQLQLRYISNNYSLITYSGSFSIVPANDSCYIYTRNFGYGAYGEDVVNLQFLLAADVGIEQRMAQNLQLPPVSTELGFFGKSTEAALRYYQGFNNITHYSDYGYFGTTTRTYFNNLCIKPVVITNDLTEKINSYANIVSATSTTPVATTTASIKVLSPNGGERFVVGDGLLVKWIASGAEKAARFIEIKLISSDSSVVSYNVYTIQPVSGPGEYRLTTTGVAPGNKFKVFACLSTSSGGGGICDYSDAYFELYTPTKGTLTEQIIRHINSLPTIIPTASVPSPSQPTNVNIPTVSLDGFVNGSSLPCDTKQVKLTWNYKPAQGIAYTMQLTDISTGNITKDSPKSIWVANPTSKYVVSNMYATTPVTPFSVTPGHSYRLSVYTAERPMQSIKNFTPALIGSINFSVPKCGENNPNTNNGSVTQYTTEVTNNNSSGSVSSINLNVATNTSASSAVTPTIEIISIGSTANGTVLPCSANKVKLSWKAISGETYYNVRIDDQTNGWTPVWDGNPVNQCTNMQSGDLCWNGYSGTGVISYAVKSGHSYRAWVDAPKTGTSQSLNFSVRLCQ